MFRQLCSMMVVATLFFAGCAGKAGNAVGRAVIAPAPSNEPLSADFTVKVGGENVPVYECRVSAMPFDRGWPGQQRPLNQTELASFAYWDMAGPVDVEVSSRNAVASVAIRPSSRQIAAKVEGNHIRFRLPAAGPVTVEVNGTHHALHLFASVPEAMAPDRKDPNVRYFGPGVHEAGRITLASNQTLYLAAGAVVHGGVDATGATNIRILGRGILDGSNYERGQGRPAGAAQTQPASQPRVRTQGQMSNAVRGCVRLTDCQNVTIEGVILRDPNSWCCTLSTCSNVSISNIKLIGLWRYNSDGIDICNSQDVTVRDTFIRSFDDSIVIKGMRGRGAGGAGGAAAEPKSVQHVLAEGCVIWDDWGRALEIGAETSAPEISDITFRNCDILRTDFAAMDIQHSDRAAIKNVLYENIRFEIDDPSVAGVIQRSDEEVFKADKSWVPRLLIIEIVKTEYARDPVRGTVANITLRDISIKGKVMPASRVQGLDAEHEVKGVHLENVRFNGVKVQKLEELGVIVKPFVEDLQLVGAAQR